MEFKLIIDEFRKEEVVVYAKGKNKLTEIIEQLVNDSNLELVGYKNKEATFLNTSDVFCFTILDDKVYALTENDRFVLKQRLYQVEERLSDAFVKINQSCIANISKIKRFDASVSGSLMVIFKNEYKEYVSRRQLKAVKERLGI